MTFLEPVRLWLLLGVAGMALAYLAVQLRRRTWTLRFTNVDLLAGVAPRRPGWRRHLPAAIYLLALATLVVGFARPELERQVPVERATVVMAIDTSLSMLATDVPPDRIRAAQAAARRFVELAPETINVGLVTFHGQASIRVPPTTGREELIEVIDTLELGQATATGEAIFAGLAAIELAPADEEATPPPAHIVLMSDGAWTTGRPVEDAVAAAQTAEVPVSTIAFGTDEGFIRIDETGRPDERAIPTPVPVDRVALEGIAADTGGEFFEAVTQEQLTRVYEEIGSSVGYTSELQEVTAWFVGSALVMLLLGGGLGLVWFSRLP